MKTVVVELLSFDFPDSWSVSKYDDWSFYRNHFCKLKTGVKALDLLAISPEKTVWLIEVKDYRLNPRTKTIDLADEVCQKVFDTLAAILPAKVRANENDEALISRQVASGLELRVALHLEQPVKHSRLFPRAIDPADVLMKLRSKVKPIDPHPIVIERNRLQGCAWTVS